MSEQNEIIERTLSITSDLCDSGKRIDAFLCAASELSRSSLARLIEQGSVTVDGKTVAKNFKLKGGEVICVELPEPDICEAVPQDIPLDIIFEDDDIIVVNKPKGMVVHPAVGNTDGTLVNALLYHCKDSLSGIGGVVRPGIVHRIDKDTGGLLVVAKNDHAHAYLSEQIKEHNVRRVYYAIALGNFPDDSGTVDAPIGRHPVDRKRMAVLKDGQGRSRSAVTHWSVVERFGAFTLVRCQLETGRTHQIRVHMAHIGHALLGDEVYGGAGTRFQALHKKYIDGQCLFAAELTLSHPATHAQMHFEAPMPEYFSRLCEILRREQ